MSGLKIETSSAVDVRPPPPWQGFAPELPNYRVRGHRSMSARTYDAHCKSCIWGGDMAVEMIIGVEVRLQVCGGRVMLHD